MAPRGEPPNQSKAAKKRSYAKRTPQARANEKKTQAYSRPGKITEAGVGNIPVSVARAAVTIAKHLSKSKSKTNTKSKTKTSSTKPKTMSASEYSKNLRETREANKNYRDAQIRRQQREVDERRAKAKADKKKPTAAQRKAAEYKASADRIERMQAGYKYKGGSGTRGGRPTR